MNHLDWVSFSAFTLSASFAFCAIHLATWVNSNWPKINLFVIFFVEEGKPENAEKNPWSWYLKLGPNWWEEPTHHCVIPASYIKILNLGLSIKIKYYIKKILK